MSIKKEPGREEVLRYLNEELNSHLREFESGSKEETASSIARQYRLNVEENWISQLERRLKRRFTAIEKFKMDILYRIYFFHGDGAGGKPSHSAGELFNE